jgi:hypothetical protein
VMQSRTAQQSLVPGRVVVVKTPIVSNWSLSPHLSYIPVGFPIFTVISASVKLQLVCHNM